MATDMLCKICKRSSDLFSLILQDDTGSEYSVFVCGTCWDVIYAIARLAIDKKPKVIDSIGKVKMLCPLCKAELDIGEDFVTLTNGESLKAYYANCGAFIQWNSGKCDFYIIRETQEKLLQALERENIRKELETKHE